jgi:type III restriction enzyme
MNTATIDKLIISSPYEEPREHWSYDRESMSFLRREGRRPAGYVRATNEATSFDDPGQFIELPLVNQIRPRVRQWREAGYPGTEGVTRRLLEHWRDPEAREGRRFFFCQIEAIETLVWLTEAPPSELTGVLVPGDGGPFKRLCSKMATGTGKTILMSMICAWQILNRVASPHDKRYSKNILLLAPGLTVRNRLSVLLPAGEANYYDQFNIVPSGLRDSLRQGQVIVRNWHALQWDNEEKVGKRRSVDKRGMISDQAYLRDVLGDMASARNLVVINDEAHHAWRPLPDIQFDGPREAKEEATRWVAGLDRINGRDGRINTCFDVSATPFIPTGGRKASERFFQWIVSDFGLNDAIEAGLVKTPRVVVRDDGVPDAATYRSKLYHLYQDPTVKDDLNRKAAPEERLPDLVTNAYYLLGRDWLEWRREWAASGHTTPPVMITVANRTETAARIKYAFDSGRIQISELQSPDRTLHIDSKVLALAEKLEVPTVVGSKVGEDDEEDESTQAEELDGDEGTSDSQEKKSKLSKKESAELLRRVVDTVGQAGQPGAQIQNVISVNMLTEGWDAKTVTHIMGLRAFTSQLLCEQVVGRGLRRTSYEVGADGLLHPEYVNVFGIPFTFLPHEGGGPAATQAVVPKKRIEPDSKKSQFEITWPNIIRIERTLRPRLTLKLSNVPVLQINAREMAFAADLAPVLEGKPDLTRLSSIELDSLGESLRLQSIIFKVAVDLFDAHKPAWKGARDVLLGQLIRLVEKVVSSDRIKVMPATFDADEDRRRIVLALTMSKIGHHIWSAIQHENVAVRTLIPDRERPILSTGRMAPWYSGRPCHPGRKSHINLTVLDSTWESSDAVIIDKSPLVQAWVKNDHLGFEVHYIFEGVVRKYRPDFLVHLVNGDMVIVETKGQVTDEVKAKHAALLEWVEAVNEHGGFGRWHAAIADSHGKIDEILAELCSKCAAIKSA